MGRVSNNNERQRAGGQGNDLAEEFKDHLEKAMTPAQLAEAQRLAREWKPKGK